MTIINSHDPLESNMATQARTVEIVIALKPGISPWGICSKEIIPQKQNIYLPRICKKMFIITSL